MFFFLKSSFCGDVTRKHPGRVGTSFNNGQQKQPALPR